MTTNSTFSVSFVARADKKRKDMLNIFTRININGKRSEFSAIRLVHKNA